MLHTTIKHMMRDKNSLIVSAVILIIGVGVGYGVHGLISPSRANNFPGGINGVSASSRINKQSNGVLTGTVASKDSGSLTIDTRDGSSRVILLTPNTGVSKNTNGSLDDVTVGSTIFVSGTTNSDGSVSASLIQLRPAMPPATMGQ